MLLPKLTISIPFSFTPSRKRKQSLEEPYRKLKFLWNREILYSKTSRVNGWRYDLLVLLFRFCFKVLFRICSESEFFANNRYSLFQKIRGRLSYRNIYSIDQFGISLRTVRSISRCSNADNNMLNAVLKRSLTFVLVNWMFRTPNTC